MITPAGMIKPNTLKTFTAMIFEVMRQVMNMAVITTNLGEYLFTCSEFFSSFTLISPWLCLAESSRFYCTISQNPIFVMDNILSQNQPLEQDEAAIVYRG